MGPIGRIRSILSNYASPTTGEALFEAALRRLRPGVRDRGAANLERTLRALDRGIDLFVVEKRHAALRGFPAPPPFAVRVSAGAAAFAIGVSAGVAALAVRGSAGAAAFAIRVSAGVAAFAIGVSAGVAALAVGAFAGAAAGARRRARRRPADHPARC